MAFVRADPIRIIDTCVRTDVEHVANLCAYF
jgi:hypothetical protein